MKNEDDLKCANLWFYELWQGLLISMLQIKFLVLGHIDNMSRLLSTQSKLTLPYTGVAIMAHP